MFLQSHSLNLKLNVREISGNKTSDALKPRQHQKKNKLTIKSSDCQYLHHLLVNGFNQSPFIRLRSNHSLNFTLDDHIKHLNSSNHTAILQQKHIAAIQEDIFLLFLAEESYVEIQLAYLKYIIFSLMKALLTTAFTMMETTHLSLKQMIKLVSY